MARQVTLLAAALILVLLGGGFLYFSATPRSGPVEDPLRSLQAPLWPAPDFELVDAFEELVRKEDLKGKVWLAAFIFTRCPGPCPLISQRMGEIQERLAGMGDFRLVSFSVDPDFDRPEVLQAYAQRWEADRGRWLFLTEDDAGEMDAVVRDFKIALQRGAAGEGEPPDITHGTSLLLVDREGQVRAVFRSSDPDVVEQVVRAVR